MKRVVALLPVAFAALLLAVSLISSRGGTEAADGINSPDTAGIIGQFASLELDGNGNPVVSYSDFTNQNLKILHCDDPHCAPGGDIITSPDTAGSVGTFTSLELDSGGFPVVSYYDATNLNLKILHCDDPNCAPGGDVINSPDILGTVGQYTSLALDTDGFPVVSYYDGTSLNLKLLHCDDIACAPGGDSITSPDTTGDVGGHASLALDADGFPVVSYYDFTNQNLKILHCDDPNCALGGDSITSPDATGIVGTYNSLALDASGFPVVGYYDATNENLKILHCGDPNCAPGGDTITSPDTAGDVGWSTSLTLDATGNPVLSYFDFTNRDLKILHCGDPNCAPGGDSITSPDTLGDVGQFTSLVLDASGHPVVIYSDDTNGDLKIIHCDDPNCAPPPPPTPTATNTRTPTNTPTATATLPPGVTPSPTSTPAGDISTLPDPGTDSFVGIHTSLVLDATGHPVVSYYDETNGDLKILHCNDPNCAPGGDSITSPDTVGDVGLYTSIALDATGNPVVSYHTFDNGAGVTTADLKILHCDDPNCAPGGDSITSPDTGGLVGIYTSLALDAAGNPVVSHWSQTSGDLKILHCNDPNCAPTGDSTTSPDTSGNVGLYTSLALDAVGNPIVSYYHADSDDLKILHCDDPNCVVAGNSITSPDTVGDIGWDTSLALDSNGFPVVSYFDFTNANLKILHCDDANCASGGDSITSPDTAGNVGSSSSLALDADGHPVVGHYDSTNTALKILHCDDPNCADGGDSSSSPETGGTFSGYTSLVLDAIGNPVVSFYNGQNSGLGILHCDDPNCDAPVAPTSTPTSTATPTNSPTSTPTATNTSTSTPTNTSTPMPTATSTATPTDTATATATFTSTSTATATSMPSDTATATFTPTNTATATSTPSNTATATFTPTGTSTSTSTPAPSITPTATNTSAPAPDSDGDGYSDAEELAFIPPENPNSYCAIMRADVNHDTEVNSGDLLLTSFGFFVHVDRYDQNPPPDGPDGEINSGDLLLISFQFSKGVDECSP